jgi:cytochrome c-type biogenesis protein
LRVVTGAAGAFLFGAAFALGWSPCIGPVLASVLAYAAAHAASPWRGAGYLAVYAAGLALPLLVLAAAATQAPRWLKRARTLLPVLEKFGAVALLGIGLWTLTDVARSAYPTAAAVAVAGEHCELDKSPGHTCALPQAVRGGDDTPAPELAVAGARLLEFTSQDCPVCRRMRPVVDKLLHGCRELDAHAVRVDVATAAGRDLADRHGVRGTPTFVLVDEQGVEKARLLGENSAEEVAAAIERAFGISCWG